jgi:hypothetical protein
MRVKAARSGGQHPFAFSVVVFSVQHWLLKSLDVAARKPGGQDTVGFSCFLHPNTLHTEPHPGKEGNSSHTFLA